MKKLLLLFTVLTLVLLPMAAMADTFFSQPGAQLNGKDVSAKADFVLGGDTLTLTLTNLLKDPESAVQCVSDIFFKVADSSGAFLTGTLSGSSGTARSVIADGTYSDGPVISPTGWKLLPVLSDPDIFHLSVVGTPTAPQQTIIGPPGDNNLYNNANPSITKPEGEPGSHNPHLAEFGTFTFAIAGLDASGKISNVVFSFNTDPGYNVPAPIPGSLLLLGTGILGLVGLRRKLS